MLWKVADRNSLHSKTGLCQQGIDDLCSLPIDQCLFATILFERHLVGVESKEMHQSCVIVEVIDFVFDGVVSEFVGGTMHARAESTACPRRVNKILAGLMSR